MTIGVIGAMEEEIAVIRAISDIAGEQSAVSFKAFIEKAAYNSASIVIEIIRELRDNAIEKERLRFEEIFDR